MGDKPLEIPTADRRLYSLEVTADELVAGVKALRRDVVEIARSLNTTDRLASTVIDEILEQMMDHNERIAKVEAWITAAMTPVSVDLEDAE